LLYKAFGWEMPVQAHLPTILDPSGKGKLSKRKKKLPDGRQMLTFVHEFRQAGYLPEAMVNFLALVGWSYDGETEFFSRDEGAFSYDKLDHMNATYIRGLGHNDLAGRLLGVLRHDGLSANFATVLKIVPLIRERIKTLNEAKPWVDFFFSEEVSYEPELLIQKKMDQASTLAALKDAERVLASVEPFDEETLEERMRVAATALGIKAGQYFGGIRVACTGKKVAPPLFGTLVILGRETVVRRVHEAVRLLNASQT